MKQTSGKQSAFGPSPVGDFPNQRAYEKARRAAQTACGRKRAAPVGLESVLAQDRSRIPKNSPLVDTIRSKLTSVEPVKAKPDNVNTTEYSILGSGRAIGSAPRKAGLTRGDFRE